MSEHSGGVSDVSIGDSIDLRSIPDELQEHPNSHQNQDEPDYAPNKVYTLLIVNGSKLASDKGQGKFKKDKITGKNGGN